MSSLIVDTDSIDDLIQQLRFHVTSSGKQYLEQLENVIKWSSRVSAARQLAIVVSSKMSRPLEVKSAFRYLQRLTASQFQPAPGQRITKDKDNEAFFALAEKLYDADLWEATEAHLETYPLLFPMAGDKIICGHSRAVCECGYVHGPEMDAFCLECSRPRTLCQNRALMNGRCADHGGRLPEGRSKGSIYRQYMAQEMADNHARLESEANLSLDAEIGVAIGYLTKAIKETPASNTAAIKAIQKRIQKSMDSEDIEAVYAATEELNRELNKAPSGAGKEVREWLDTIARLTSQERESRKVASEYIHVDEHQLKLDEMVQAFRAGMDRSYNEMRRLTRQFIERAMDDSPGEAPAAIASRVIRDLLDSEQVIESFLLSPYHDAQH